MPFSTFAHYMTTDGVRLPEATRRAILAEGMQRYRERLAAGRADAPLCFRDLIERAERSLAGV